MVSFQRFATCSFGSMFLCFHLEALQDDRNKCRYRLGHGPEESSVVSDVMGSLEEIYPRQDAPDLMFPKASQHLAFFIQLSPWAWFGLNVQQVRGVKDGQRPILL
ncbi:hypothetical protein TNCT_689971 [Trichonephila clavata]|uniref:Uncharacterized protein n=1 Tax=Trichonephila clavata TaxID=2740835 RepID=A0A8X6FEP8_TRICU|nr:hypothetical protein TNCT_689971 [Trichonephila clavata]